MGLGFRGAVVTFKGVLVVCLRFIVGKGGGLFCRILSGLRLKAVPYMLQGVHDLDQPYVQRRPVSLTVHDKVL